MEDTEDIQVMAFHVGGFDFTELSSFPRLNSVKNCYNIQMMRDDYVIESNEWFIPKNFKRPPLDEIVATKKRAIALAEEKLEALEALRDKLTEEQYDGLYMRFKNLLYVSKLWERLIASIIGYSKYFEYGEEKYKTMFLEALEDLTAINEDGKATLGVTRYYPTALGTRRTSNPKDIDVAKIDKVAQYVKDAKASFEYEAALEADLKSEGLVDFIIPGSGNEGHKLFKEVNFSDTFILDDGVCRIAGTYRGKAFSTVNAHGWFRYEIAVKPNSENEILITAKGSEPSIDFSADIAGEKTVIREAADGKREISIKFTEKEGRDRVQLRLDRISASTPFFYLIKVKA